MSKQDGLKGRGLDLNEIAALAGAAAPIVAPSTRRRIVDVADLAFAAPWHLTFFDSEGLASAAATTRAGACITTVALAPRLPACVAAIAVEDPYRAFVTVARALFADSLQPSSLYPAGDSVHDRAQVHPSARLEPEVTIEPGAVIGPGAEIGAGTVVAANAAIGGGVRIGRNCLIGAGTTIGNALIGDRVRIHAGCHVGEAGVDLLAADRALKLTFPARGRVIIQDDVEIGAGSTIDRGGIRDTVVGEGTKIDNLVRVSQNAAVGRGCLLVGQSSISANATLEDHVVLGARVGVNGAVTIGEGARVGAASTVTADVPAGALWAEEPAGPAIL